MEPLVMYLTAAACNFYILPWLVCRGASAFSRQTFERPHPLGNVFHRNDMVASHICASFPACHRLPNSTCGTHECCQTATREGHCHMAPSQEARTRLGLADSSSGMESAPLLGQYTLFEGNSLILPAKRIKPLPVSRMGPATKSLTCISALHEHFAGTSAGIQSQDGSSGPCASRLISLAGT